MAFEPKVYKDQSGDRMVVASGGTLKIESGGTLDLDGTLDGAGNLELDDSVSLKFGTGDDITVAWDGTDLDILPAADDSVIKVGNGTLSADLWVYGNIAGAYLLWDASANTFRLVGPVRPTSLNALSARHELKWVAGQRGKPGINGDILSATEAVRMIADPDFEVLGTNASSDDVTYNAEGGILLTTDGADGDGVIILPHLDANQSPWTGATWGTDKEVEWECWIETGAAITNSIIWAGLKLTNTDVVATDDDQAYFRYEDGVNDGEWEAVSSIGGTDTATDTNVVVAVSTQYHLKIAIAADRTAQFWINGVLVETSAALTDATDLIPYIAIEADGAAEAKTLVIYGQAISRVAG